jgi:hypothetical protein
MAYKDKHGITQIRSGRLHNLSISRDYDRNPQKHYPILLVVPDLEQFQHHHVKLTKTQARKLHEWLGHWLKERG